MNILKCLFKYLFFIKKMLNLVRNEILCRELRCACLPVSAFATNSYVIQQPVSKNAFTPTHKASTVLAYALVVFSLTAKEQKISGRCNCIGLVGEAPHCAGSGPLSIPHTQAQKLQKTELNSVSYSLLLLLGPINVMFTKNLSHKLCTISLGSFTGKSFSSKMLYILSICSR